MKRKTAKPPDVHTSQLRETALPRTLTERAEASFFDELPISDSTEHYKLAAVLYGGRVDPGTYSRNELGIDQYFQDLGVRRFRGVEFVRPRYPRLAAELYPNAIQTDMRDGRILLIPGRWVWPRLACLAWIADRCALSQDGPVFVQHVWRPRKYNDHPRVQGKPASDHLTATGVDLLFTSIAARKRATHNVIAPLWRLELFGLSVGLGSRKLHVGVFSPRGRRRWTYRSHPKPFPF